MTPTAAALIRELQSEARHYDDITTTDAPAIARYRAEAKRDTLDALVNRLQKDFATIEEEAAAEALGTAEWLEAGAGIGDGTWEALPDAA